jgi:hypothetical protein
VSAPRPRAAGGRWLGVATGRWAGGRGGHAGPVGTCARVRVWCWGMQPSAAAPHHTRPHQTQRAPRLRHARTVHQRVRRGGCAAVGACCWAASPGTAEIARCAPLGSGPCGARVCTTAAVHWSHEGRVCSLHSSGCAEPVTTVTGRGGAVRGAARGAAASVERACGTVRAWPNRHARWPGRLWDFFGCVARAWLHARAHTTQWCACVECCWSAVVLVSTLGQRGVRLCVCVPACARPPLCKWRATLHRASRVAQRRVCGMHTWGEPSCVGRAEGLFVGGSGGWVDAGAGGCARLCV